MLSNGFAATENQISTIISFYTSFLYVFYFFIPERLSRHNYMLLKLVDAQKIATLSNSHVPQLNLRPGSIVGRPLLLNPEAVDLGVVVEGKPGEAVSDELGNVVAVRLLRVKLGGGCPESTSESLEVSQWTGKDSSDEHLDGSFVTFLGSRNEPCCDFSPTTHVVCGGVVLVGCPCDGFLPFWRPRNDDFWTRQLTRSL